MGEFHCDYMLKLDFTRKKWQTSILIMHLIRLSEFHYDYIFKKRKKHGQHSIVLICLIRHDRGKSLTSIRWRFSLSWWHDARCPFGRTVQLYVRLAKWWDVDGWNGQGFADETSLQHQTMAPSNRSKFIEFIACVGGFSSKIQLNGNPPMIIQDNPPLRTLHQEFGGWKIEQHLRTNSECFSGKPPEMSFE